MPYSIKEFATIGSADGLSYVWRKATPWTNANLQWNLTYNTNGFFQENGFEDVSKMHPFYWTLCVKRGISLA